MIIMIKLAPSVYIGCLACHNSGRLVGEWFDALEAGDVTVAQIQAHEGYDPNHEEVWVFDYADFGGLLTGETSPAHAQEIAEIIDKHLDSEDECWAFAAWLADRGEDPDEDLVERFREAYQGTYDSEEDFAQFIAEELDEIPDHLANYIDWEKYARDLFMGDYWSEDTNYGVYVFRSM